MQAAAPMKWLADQPLRRQLQFTLGLVLLLLVAESVFAAWTTLTIQRLHQQAGQSTYVIARANEALKNLIDMETGYRGFLLTGDQSFLEPYASGEAAFGAVVGELRQQSATDPAQLAQWDDLYARESTWHREITEPGIALRRFGLR